MTIVTDSTSNMTRAFEFPLPRFVTEKKSDVCDNSYSDDECIVTAEENTSFQHEDPLLKCLPKRSRCYAHSLQLVVKDGSADASQHLKNIIAKASNIVTHARKSVHATDILEGEKRFQAYNATRWNSQLRMIRSVLGAPEEKLKQIDVQKLTAYERKHLQELCTILTPFERVTDLVQQENNISKSLTEPMTIGLKHQLQQISSIYSNKMMTTLKSLVHKRLSDYV